MSALDDVRGGVIPSSAPARAIAGQTSQTSLWRRLHFTPTRAALAATLLVAVGSVLTVRRAGQRDDQHIPSASTVVAPIIAPSTSQPSSPPQPQAQTSAELAHKVAPTPSPTLSNAASAPAVASAPANRALSALAAKPSSSVADAQRVADSVRSATVDRVAAAPAAPANAPAVAITGAAKPSADSTRAVAPERRAEVTALEGVAGTAKTSAMRSFALAPSVEGCYEVHADSASSSAAGILPRFELTSSSGVRSVTPEGRPDSTAAVGRWELLTPNVVRVRFAQAREQQPFTLQFGSASLTGRAGAGDRATNVAVARIACRR